MGRSPLFLDPRTISTSCIMWEDRVGVLAVTFRDFPSHSTIESSQQEGPRYEELVLWDSPFDSHTDNA